MKIRKGIFFIFAVFFCVPLSVYGQQNWMHVYGDTSVAEWADHMLPTRDGGLLIAGGATDLTTSSHETDTLFLKLDSNGNKRWAKTYGFAGREDWIQSVQQTSDSGYVALCTSKLSASQWDVFILKLDADGEILWKKKIVPNTSYTIWVQLLEETTDGGYMIDGDINAPTETAKDFFLMKLDAQGNILWNKVTGGGDLSLRAYWTHLYRQTADGGFIGSGADWTLLTMSNDLLLRHCDSNGSVIWEKTYGQKYDVFEGFLVEEWGEAVCQTRGGDFAAAGPYIKTSVPSYLSERDFCIIRTDDVGNLKWAKRYGIENTIEKVLHMQPTSCDNGFLIDGIYESSPEVWEPFILKTNPDGSIQWQKSFQCRDAITRVSRVEFIREVPDGCGYYVFGEIQENQAKTRNKFLLMLDANGSILWQMKFADCTESYCLHTVMQHAGEGFMAAGQSSALGSSTDDILVMNLNSFGALPECAHSPIPRVPPDGAIDLMDTPFSMAPIDAVVKNAYLPDYKGIITIDDITNITSGSPAMVDITICDK